MKNRNEKNNEKTVMVDGMMTFGKLNDGRHTADFMTYEGAEIEPFQRPCKVQAMRGGCVYITEYPKRIKNKPIFRQDNSSLSLGRNGLYYFVFTLPKEQLAELPEKLVRQANEAAAKASGLFYKKEETGGKR
jgi:hypothetical protein